MLNLLKVDTRVADGSTAVLFEDWAHGSNATGVLVEDNIALILDELQRNKLGQKKGVKYENEPCTP